MRKHCAFIALRIDKIRSKMLGEEVGVGAEVTSFLTWLCSVTRVHVRLRDGNLTFASNVCTDNSSFITILRCIRTVFSVLTPVWNTHRRHSASEVCSVFN